MNIKAILPWFGGKRVLAQQIINIIGTHKVYWEPFCGSMAILMAKNPVEMETVNDLHGDLINLAMVIQDEKFCRELFDRINRTLYCEQLWREAKKRWSGRGSYVGMDIDRAYDYFVISWIGINGVSGTERCNYQFAMRWCIGGGQGATRWRSIIESMPAWHNRLQNVVILNRDAFELIENIKDEEQVAIYIDPPYFDKSDKYVHDFDEQSHIRLAESLKRFKKAKIVVSYYDDERLDELYPYFGKIYLEKNYASLRNATRGPKKNPRKMQREIVLVKNIKESLYDLTPEPRTPKPKT